MVKCCIAICFRREIMLIRNKKFSDVTAAWLLLKKLSVKRSTFYKYKYIVNKYILIYFQNKRIYYFTHYNFNLYIAELSKTLSSKTINSILIVFKSLLRYIEKSYNLDFRLDLISSLKIKKQETKILSRRDMRVIESYCLMNDDLRMLGVEISLLTRHAIG